MRTCSRPITPDISKTVEVREEESSETIVAAGPADNNMTLFTHEYIVTLFALALSAHILTSKIVPFLVCTFVILKQVVSFSLHARVHFSGRESTATGVSSGMGFGPSSEPILCKRWTEALLSGHSAEIAEVRPTGTSCPRSD